MKNKKICILGAGHWQINYIKDLIKNGYKNIYVIDSRKNKLNNIKYIKKFYISEFEIKNVLSFVKKKKIDFCFSCSSDYTLYALNSVQKYLGHKYIKHQILNKILKKINFRKFQKSNNLNHPKFFYKKKDLINLKKLNNFLIKPNCSSDSRGIVEIINKSNPYILKKHIKFTKQVSWDKKILVEKKLKGIEYGGNCIVENGEIKFLFITKKIKNKFITIGHIIPAYLSNNYKKKIQLEIKKLLDLLNIKNSIINFDLIISKKKIYILEITPRGGGNGINNIIESKYLINCENELLRTNKRFKTKRDNLYHCSYIIRANVNAKIRLIKKKNINDPRIKKIFFFKKKGDIVNFNINEISQIGLVIFTIKSIKDYKKLVNYINQRIIIKY